MFIIDRIMSPIPEPWNTLARYAIVIAVVVGILTFLMRLWERLKPKRSIEEINKVSGKHARSMKREARMAERAGNLRTAADTWKALGKTAKAMDLYKKAGALDRVGELLIADGKASEAISIWENSGNYVLAAKQLAKDGMNERAAMNFAKAGNHQQAAEMFEHSQNYEQAGEFYSKAGFHAKAASNFLKANMALPAAISLEKYFLEKSVHLKGQLSPDKEQSIRELAKRSGGLYQKAGKLNEAVEIFVRGGYNVEAAKILEGLGEKGRAAKLYEEAGRHDMAAGLLAGTDDTRAKSLHAEALKNQGKFLEAAKTFADAGEFHEAADLYARADMPLEAAKLLMQAGSYADAAALFMQAGNKTEAAGAYEAARDYNSAIKIFEQLKDEEGVIRVMLKDGRRIEASQRLTKLGRTREAYQSLQEIGPEETEWREACLLMAKMHIAANRLDTAIQLIQRGIKGDIVGPETMELYYALGRLFEQRRDYPLAIDIFSRLLAENIAFKDVALRHQQLRDQLLHTAPAQAPIHDKTMVYDKEGGGARQNPRYNIIEELGRGGMGVVYKAMDTVLDRLVAYKVLPPDLKNHPKVVESFGKEAKALAALHHPNIVMVFDAGGIGGEYFFAMEFVEGQNLKEMIREKGAIPLSETIRVSTELAGALDYAHNRKIIHRDIKTANVMINNEGAIKLMDFGLAKVLGDAAAGRTAVSGTPYYMSPEQTLGEGIDHRTDIYSLGVMMYELATGQVPFREGDIGYHHLHTTPVPPRDIKPEIPESLQKIILKCMAKKKEDRYQTAGDLVNDLRQIEIS